MLLLDTYICKKVSYYLNRILGKFNKNFVLSINKIKYLRIIEIIRPFCISNHILINERSNPNDWKFIFALKVIT